MALFSGLLDVTPSSDMYARVAFWKGGPPVDFEATLNYVACGCIFSSLA
jgi:hypothetical protein